MELDKEIELLESRLGVLDNNAPPAIVEITRARLAELKRRWADGGISEPAPVTPTIKPPDPYAKTMPFEELTEWLEANNLEIAGPLEWPRGGKPRVPVRRKQPNFRTTKQVSRKPGNSETRKLNQ